MATGLAISCSDSALKSTLRTLDPPAATVEAIEELEASAEGGVCPTRPTLRLCSSGGSSTAITEPIG